MPTKMGSGGFDSFKPGDVVATPSGGLCKIVRQNSAGMWLAEDLMSGKTESFYADQLRKMEQGGQKMPGKLSKLAKFVKMEEDADDKAIKEAVLQKMDEAAVSAMSGGAYNYDDSANQLEQMAQAYEDSGYADESDKDEPPPMTMRKMADKFRRMGKMGGPSGDTSDVPVDKMDDMPPPEMAQFARSLGIDVKNQNRTQLWDSIRAATVPAAKIPQLVQASVKNAVAEEKAAQRAQENKARSAQLMSILPTDYPGDRDALRRLAERDPIEAEKLAKPFLPKTGVPAHLFDKMSHAGSPIGKNARTEAGPTVRTTKAMGRKFVEEDAGFADEIKRVASSTDPTEKAKVDVHLSEPQRGVFFNRLIAAEKVVRMERPDLAEQGE